MYRETKVCSRKWSPRAPTQSNCSIQADPHPKYKASTTIYVKSAASSSRDAARTHLNRRKPSIQHLANQPPTAPPARRPSFLFEPFRRDGKAPSVEARRVSPRRVGGVVRKRIVRVGVNRRVCRASVLQLPVTGDSDVVPRAVRKPGIFEAFGCLGNLTGQEKFPGAASTASKQAACKVRGGWVEG